ncbi:hypothetical protein [Aquisphaera insulae]|uniref:hypothetical protein n=1 Tax=Aquisphaera insulae TaxID=2712864 RepID=UPI0013EE39C0|nr:hypothetical protein [Aquisphaera insulae]
MLTIIRKTPFAFVMFSMLGLMGRGAFGQEPAGGPASAKESAAPASPAAGTDPKAAQVALLVDGKVVRGVITEEGRNVVVSQPIGSKKYPKSRIEKIFDTMEEAYAYKVAQLPEEDFDERIKLARWCLVQNMEPRAREQLRAILDQSPDHKEAKAMITMLDQAQARAGMAKQDPEIQQAGAVQVQPGEAGAGRPDALDPSVLARARRGMGISDMPVVFDLPQAQAVKAAVEFSKFVHPVLQKSCARCHNSDRYEGSFQLIEFKTKLDSTPEALRSNLDATLKLIDRESPARSELLSSTLRAHGSGPNPRPIFQGSNDMSYRILAAWANKLQAKPDRNSAAGGDGAVAAGLAAPAGGGDAQGEGFASQRGRISTGPGSISTPLNKPFVTGPVVTKSLPPLRAVPGRGMVLDNENDPKEFPVPFAMGGAPPSAATRPDGQAAAVPSRSAAAKPSASSPVKAPSTAAAVDEDATAAPTRAPKEGEGEDAEAPPATKKKPKAPVKLDPSLLQKALQMRNQNRAPN